MTANVVITITKNLPEESWIILTKTFIKNNFTIEEINDIIIPYQSSIKNLTGWQNTEILYPNDITMIIKHTFDSLINANNALSYFQPPFESDSLQEKMRLLLLNTRNKLGINYTWNHLVE